jgi:sec-independent protein translocase protein TatA
MSMGFTEILVIVALIIIFFGSGRLRNLGSDIGGFIKGLRSSLREAEELPEAKSGQGEAGSHSGRVIEGEVAPKSEKPKS